MVRFSLNIRFAVYTLFGKARSNLGKNILHPQKYALPYTYGYVTKGIRLRSEVLPFYLICC